MNNFFRNRYGFDKLNLILILFSLLFIFSRYLWPIGVLVLAFAAFRATSRNFLKRQTELRKFEMFLSGISNFTDRTFRPLMRWIENGKTRRAQKKIYKYVKCRYCKKKLRVPRKKGKIKVTCPECKNQFITKT